MANRWWLVPKRPVMAEFFASRITLLSHLYEFKGVLETTTDVHLWRGSLAGCEDEMKEYPVYVDSGRNVR